MLIRTLLATTIIAASVTAALYSRAPADAGPQVQTDIYVPAANLPQTRIVDYTFVFIEGETGASTCSPASPGTSC